MINFGAVPAGAVLPIMFNTYAAATGASVTLTGLAVTDIEVYKGTSMTQRASDAGFVLLDTDGIDLDGVTGIHGFSIDTGDNTDASFYAVGSFFTVVVSAVTIDSQTVNFVAATFRIVAAEGVAGYPKADTSHFAGTAITAAAGIPEVKVASIAANAITATAINADAITAAKIADGAIDAATFAASAITSTVLANDAITAAKVHDDVSTEIRDKIILRTTVRGAAATGTLSTTQCTTSGMSPAMTAADQLKGRILIFDHNTTTAALQGQATDITANSAASNPLLTFTALTTAPANGDTFTIV